MAHDLPFTLSSLRDAAEVLHAARRAARFHDVDAALTVFFPKYFEFASDAYVEFLCARGVDVPRVVASQAWLAPLVHVEADYASPLRFGDPFVVEVVAAHAGATSYALGYRMRSDDAGARLLATMITVHVCIDPATFRAAPLPDALRRALTSRATGASSG